MLLDAILNEAENQELIGAAIRASIRKDPMKFFRSIIMPLLPRDLTLKFGEEGIVQWTSILQAFPRQNNLPNPNPVATVSTVAKN